MSDPKSDWKAHTRPVQPQAKTGYRFKADVRNEVRDFVIDAHGSSAFDALDRLLAIVRRGYPNDGEMCGAVKRARERELGRGYARQAAAETVAATAGEGGEG